MNTITKDFVSDIELARRLELFDQNQRLEAEKKVLEDRLKAKDLAHVEEISRIKHLSGDPVETVIGMLRDYPSLQEQLECLRGDNAYLLESLDQAEADKTTLADQLEQLTAAAASAADYRDAAGKKLDAIMRELEVAQSAVRHRDGELKELKALNPKKLREQNKRLQTRNGELMEIDKRNKQTLKEMRKQLAEMATVKRHNGERMEALDDACNMMQSGEVKDRLWESDDGKWALIGHEETPQKIFILYLPTGELRVFDRAEEVVPAPRVPPHVKDVARAKLERYSKIDAQLKPYQKKDSAA